LANPVPIPVKSKDLNRTDLLKGHMTQIKVNHLYEVLLLLLKKEMHQRELSKELKTSLTRIQSILAELRNINVLDYKEEGKNHIYFIKKNMVSKSLILNAENYKLVKLLRKYPSLEPILKEVIEKCTGKIIMLFGSYSKFIPNHESDIDIYVDAKDAKIKEKLIVIHDDLSIQAREFNKEDLLIKEIIKNHVILNNGEEYYEKLGFFK